MADGAWESKLVIISLILVIIGGINWGIIGLFNNNLVTSLNNATFRSVWLERTIYVLIGVAAVYLIFKSTWSWA